jgi:hypothetical protein
MPYRAARNTGCSNETNTSDCETLWYGFLFDLFHKLGYSCNHARTVLVPQVASQERHRLEIALSRLSYVTVNPFRGVQRLVTNAVNRLTCRSLSVSLTGSYLKFIMINNLTGFVTSDGKSKTQNCKNKTVKNSEVVPVCAMKTNGWSRCSAASNRGIR